MLEGLIELIVGLALVSSGLLLFLPRVMAWFDETFLPGHLKVARDAPTATPEQRKLWVWVPPERRYKEWLWMNRYLIRPFLLIIGVLMMIGGTLALLA